MAIHALRPESGQNYPGVRGQDSGSGSLRLTETRACNSSDSGKPGASSKTLPTSDSVSLDMSQCPSVKSVILSDHSCFLGVFCMFPSPSSPWKNVLCNTQGSWTLADPLMEMISVSTA